MAVPRRRLVRSTRSILAWAALGVVVVALFGGALVWHAGGGRWLNVATPSMGRAAPVGTLVLTRPVNTTDVHIGDVITFHPPTVKHETYTHRASSIDAHGALHTRGDINGAADPWALHDQDLVGRVVARWWGVGWLLRALPFLIIGALVVWLVTGVYASARYRAPMRVFGLAAVFSLTGFILKPFVRMAVIATSADVHGARASIVSTGLLPIRVTAGHGTHADLADGHVGLVATPVLSDGGRYPMNAVLHMSLLWWVVVVLLCASPLLWCLTVGLPPVPGPPVQRRGSGQKRRRRTSYAARAAATAGICAALLLAADIASPATSEAAFTARVTNSTDTVVANPYFTCLAAAETDNAFFAYPLDDVQVAGVTRARDVSGNGRDGTYQGTILSLPGDAACKRDSGGSSYFNGNSSYVSTPTKVTNPTVFTEEVWFKTTTAGGELMGFGSAKTGLPGQHDRHLFMTDAGKLVFSVNAGSVKEVISPSSYNNGTWHYAAVTLSSAGMKLYADGALAASNAAVTSAEVDTGYWRVGWNDISGSANQPTNFYFTGRLAYASVYTTALTATQIATHFAAGN